MVGFAEFRYPAITIELLGRRTVEKGITGGFGSKDRLLKRSEFLHLTRYGRKIQNNDFILFYLPGRLGRPRLGVTVSRRVGNAVVRNRTKRLIRECFRRSRQNFSANWDMNIIARPAAAGKAADEMDASLHRLFSKIRAGSSSKSSY